MNYAEHSRTERQGFSRMVITLLALCLPMLAATLFSGNIFNPGSADASSSMEGMGGTAHAAMSAAADPNKIADGAKVITLSNGGFSPANVTVDAGTPIAWVNKSASSRTIQVTQPVFFGSSALQNGNVFHYVFLEAGTYPYRTGDGAFAGTVTVKGVSKSQSANGTNAGCTANGTASISVTSTGFNPNTITVNPATAVTWTNNSGDRARIRDINHVLFDSDDLSQGQSFTYVFCDQGSFQYENSRAEGEPTGVVIVGSSGGTATPTPTGTTTPGVPPTQVVNVFAQRHDTFFPADITISTGTTVRWTNQDEEQHTSTSDTGVWNSGALNQGQAFEFTFLTPGVYNYSCLFHLGEMTGVVRVTGDPITPTPGTPTATPTIPAGGTVDASIQNYAFAPQNMTILVGTTVRWTNQDADAHTATSDTGAFNSGTLGQGQQFSFTFNTAGTFAYHCAIHPGMTGTITVVNSLPTPGSPTVPPSATSQPSVTSQPSTTVNPSTTAQPTNTPGLPVDVSISGFSFTPQNLTVQVGQTVKWTNHDQTPHTVAESTGMFNSGNLPLNGTYSFTFTAPGTYSYACGYHPAMTGSITVINGPTSTPQPSVTGTAQTTATSQPSSTGTIQPSATATHSSATNTPQPTPGTVDVAIQLYAYNPITVTIQAGTTVRWTNLDNDLHSVTDVNGLFDSGTFGLNGTWSYTFNTPGTYEYYCTVHGQFMTGWVVVEAGNACAIGFTDVPAGSTFYEFVQCLTCRGIIGGYPDGTFRPSNTVTRGQLAKIVSNAAGYAETPTGQTFSDVPASDTFYVFVERAVMHGILNGYADGTFRPGNNASRGQISKIVSNAAGYNDTVTGQTFQDVPTGSTFYIFVERLATRAIMNGYACGGTGEPCVAPGNLPYFRPANDATRGQVAKIVSNTFFPNCQP